MSVHLGIMTSALPMCKRSLDSTLPNPKEATGDLQRGVSLDSNARPDDMG